VKEGDILYYNTWGGGGAGDPFEREPERVGKDVERGLVSVQGARRYGVVCNESGNVDGPATTSLREELRADRSEIMLFDFGGTLEEIKLRCKQETGLEPPKTPVFTRRGSGMKSQQFS
jgi:N-methylhydantoinase B